MYVHSSFAVDLCNTVGDIELLIVSLCFLKSALKYCIALFYRPPSASVNCFDCLSRNIFNLNPSLLKYFILLGDFKGRLTQNISFFIIVFKCCMWGIDDSEIFLKFSGSSICEKGARLLSSFFVRVGRRGQCLRHRLNGSARRAYAYTQPRMNVCKRRDGETLCSCRLFQHQR